MAGKPQDHIIDRANELNKHMACGGDVKEFAAMHNVPASTVRTHLVRLGWRIFWLNSEERELIRRLRQGAGRILFKNTS